MDADVRSAFVACSVVWNATSLSGDSVSDAGSDRNEVTASSGLSESLRRWRAKAPSTVSRSAAATAVATGIALVIQGPATTFQGLREVLM
jgi:hypothetical protein